VTLEVLGQDEEATASGTMQVGAPTATIAEIGLTTFQHLYTSNDITAWGVFTGCTTDGSNAGLPPVETFAYYTASGAPREVVIRNGLTSISYELDISNCEAHFTINLFFWPAVDRGTA